MFTIPIPIELVKKGWGKKLKITINKRRIFIKFLLPRFNLIFNILV